VGQSLWIYKACVGANIMPFTEKRKIIDLLGDKAFAFSLYCNNKATDDAKSIAYMFENLPGMDMNSGVFRGVIQILLSEGVIDQAVIDRVKNKLQLEVYP